MTSINNVFNLTLKDFSVNGFGQMTIKHPAYNNKNGFVVFMHSFCPHCKNTNFMDTLGDLAMMLGSVVPVGSVNCSDTSVGNDKLYPYAKLGNTPTIKWVRKDGTMILYEGPRTKFHMLEFVCSETGNCKRSI